VKFLGVMCVLPGASKGVNPESRAGGIRLGPSRSSGPETYEACAIRQTWGFPGANRSIDAVRSPRGTASSGGCGSAGREF